MSSGNITYNLAMQLRRFPVVHRPLKWARRKAFQKFKDVLVEAARTVSSSEPRWGPPKGSFSIYEDLLKRPNPGRKGRIVLHDQGPLPVSPDSLLERCGLRQHLEQPRPILWSHHQAARLVSSSLALINEQKQVALESVYGTRFLHGDTAYRYLHLPPAVPLPGNWTSLVSLWVPTTGVPTFSHWVLDALPRLSMLGEFPSDTRILVPSALAAYQKETLALLGLQERIRYTPETHLTIENYYFASPTTMISCYNPYGIGFLRSEFLPKADPSYHGPKKFIIQRKGKSRGIKNEEEVNKFFRDRGWDIIDTEKLTFSQEIKLFSEAEAVCGILGSGFTNTIWCRPGCKVITLVADSWLDGWAEAIAHVCKLQYSFAVFPSDHMMMATIDLEVVKKLLQE